MRKIYFTKWGIHFEVKGKMINAHWKDFFGLGIKNDIISSMKRFWEHIISGIKLVIKGDIHYDI